MLLETVVCWMISIFLSPYLSGQQLSLVKGVLISCCPPFQSVMGYEIRQKLIETAST